MVLVLGIKDMRGRADNFSIPSAAIYDIRHVTFNEDSDRLRRAYSTIFL